MSEVPLQALARQGLPRKKLTDSRELLSSPNAKCKTVQARLWPCLAGGKTWSLSSRGLFAWKRLQSTHEKTLTNFKGWPCHPAVTLEVI